MSKYRRLTRDTVVVAVSCLNLSRQRPRDDAEIMHCKCVPQRHQKRMMMNPGNPKFLTTKNCLDNSP